MDIEADEPLELDEVQIADEEHIEEETADETVISFSDEPEEGEDESRLVKQLRDQVKALRQEKRRQTVAEEDNDPEPVIPARPSLEALNYDQDEFDRQSDAREQAVLSHAEWKTRQTERENAKKRASEEQGKRIEQQVRALGVSDFEARRDAVAERLSEQQMMVLLSATDNPGRLIYALGRSELRLDELAGIDNLARFAARIGQLDKEIRVTKKRAPAPESRVVGATASTVAKVDKHLERLEREAERTGNRTEVQRYKRSLKQRAA